jgi:thiol:disulfide interchange protein
VITRAASLLGITLAGVVIWLCSSTSDSKGVTFRPFDPAALESARVDNKPIVLYMAAGSDPACQEQNRGALRDERVIAALEPFARFRMLVPANSAVTEQLRALGEKPSLPMFIFMTANGTEVEQLVGVQSAEAILEAVAKVKQRAEEPQARVRATRSSARQAMEELERGGK